MKLVSFLILSLLSSVALYKQVECDIEYWVRPTAVSSCPPSVPQEQCVTITDLVSNTANASISGYNNVSVYFLPGVHVPTRSGWIVFGKTYEEGYQYSFTGIINGITNKTKLDNRLTLIDCKNESKVSLLFLHFSSLSLSNLELQNCGYYAPLHEQVNAEGYDAATAAAICVINTPDINLSYVTIKNSFRIGLVLKNVIDKQIIWQIDNLIMHGNPASRKTKKATTGPQGNALFLISSDWYSERISTIITIKHSNFSKGSGKCLQNNFNNVRACTSGGLTIQIHGVKHDIDIEVLNCNFVSNQAVTGGGMLVLINSIFDNRARFGFPWHIWNNFDYFGSLVPNSYKSNLKISKSFFIENLATLKGGGLYLSQDTSVNFRTQQVTVQQTNFTKNKSITGGAIFVVQCCYKVKGCFFFKNTAEAGIGIYSKGQEVDSSSVILSSNFEQNSFHKSGYSISNTRHYSGTSVIVQNQAKLCLVNVTIANNNGRGLYLFEASLVVSDIVIIANNYAQMSNGGGIWFDCSLKITKSVLKETSKIINLALDEEKSFNKLILHDNRADGVGGGIAIKESCSLQEVCFIDKPIDNRYDVIQMVNNTAKLGGDSIYGGNLEYCPFDSIFQLTNMNTASAISSPPHKVCICSTDFPFTHKCSQMRNITIFPGQAFQIPLVCVGQLNYSAPCIVRTELSNVEDKNTANIADIYTLQHLGLACERISYSINAFKTEVTVSVVLTIQNSIIEYKWEKQLIPAVVNVRIKACLPGFVQNSATGQCMCTQHLLSKGVTCSENGRLHKAISMWVGLFGNHMTAHKVCPFNYCKSNFTFVDPLQLEEQCEFNRTGILCGGCPPGFSLALGTSQCKECSDVYLLLLLPFALVGILLIIFLLKCNLTVSTGTINGLIFYANIVHAIKTAFFPANSTNSIIKVLSVFIAWINLDLGLETCFIDGLNAYYRTWLQFVFPLYIWALVIILIITSRYSITVSRWTGSNTVSVLATLFLLSYAKLLRTTLDIFSLTYLENENGTTTSLWLLDGRYTFLEWPHSLLFTAGLVTLLAHILPFTVFLLLGPVLQRYSHRKPLRWINKLMPLLDAYHGPYNKNIRFWTGFLLLVRFIILLAVALDVAGNQAINLFVITIVLSVTLLIMMILRVTKFYRKTFQNILEHFFLGNLLIFSMASQFLLSNAAFKISKQDVLTICMVSAAFAVCILILLYHCYNACLKYKRFRKLETTVTAYFLKPKRVATPDSQLGQINCNDVNVSTLPSRSVVSIADLQEPLLDDSDISTTI